MLSLVAATSFALAISAVVAQAPTTSVAPTAPPTWAPPKFDGYIALSQYRCMDFMCHEWSMGVSRVATECFTWDCQYEQKHLNTLVGTAAIADMSFKILTAFHAPTRAFYTLGVVDPSSGKSRLWTSTIADNVNSSTPFGAVQVTFPWSQMANPIVSLEAHPVSGEPIALFADGTVGTITNGTFHKKGMLLEANSTRVVTQATAVNIVGGQLYALAMAQPGFGTNEGWPTILTLDLTSWQKVADVNTPNMSATYADPPLYFETTWVPQINVLVVFATGNFDSIFYMDPTNGNTTTAVLDLAVCGNFVTYFQDDDGTKSWDSHKNNAFDATTGMLYSRRT
jgi:hypothetical protein